MMHKIEMMIKDATGASFLRGDGVIICIGACIAAKSLQEKEQTANNKRSFNERRPPNTNFSKDLFVISISTGSPCMFS